MKCPYYKKIKGEQKKYKVAGFVIPTKGGRNYKAIISLGRALASFSVANIDNAIGRALLETRPYYTEHNARKSAERIAEKLSLEIIWAGQYQTEQFIEVILNGNP